MGIKRSNERKDKKGNFIQSSLIKKDCSYCSNCPNKLYVKDDETIVFGTGTISTKVMMVLPSLEENYYENSNIINILASLYNRITGRNIFEDCYITFATKCQKFTDYDIFVDAFKHCNKLLRDEIDRIYPKDIILFGNTVYAAFGFNDRFGPMVLHKLLNPNVFYKDKELWEIFKKQFAVCVLTIMDRND